MSDDPRPCSTFIPADCGIIDPFSRWGFHKGHAQPLDGEERARAAVRFFYAQVVKQANGRKIYCWGPTSPDKFDYTNISTYKVIGVWQSENLARLYLQTTPSRGWLNCQLAYIVIADR